MVLWEAMSPLTLLLVVKRNNLLQIGIKHYLRLKLSLKTLIGCSNLGFTINIIKSLFLVSTTMPNRQDRSIRVGAFGLSQTRFDFILHTMKLHEHLVKIVQIIVHDELMIQTRKLV